MINLKSILAAIIRPLNTITRHHILIIGIIMSIRIQHPLHYNTMAH